MKILLIHPPDSHEKSILGNLKYPPMGVAFLSAVLRNNNYEVSILDAHVADLSVDEIIQYIAKNNPDIIGVSFTSLLFESAVMLAKAIRRVFPGKIIIAGGYHPTVNPEEVLRIAPFDFVIIGEGEKTILELIHVLNSKSSVESLHQIKGLAFWENEAIIITEPQGLISNIDEIPMPAYDLLPLAEYSSLASTRTPFVTFIRSRGCPYRCIFCGVQHMFGRGYRCQSPDKTLQEIDVLVKQFGVREILFKDSDFLIKKKNVLELCKKLKAKKYDLIWSCNARVDEIDEEIVEAMKKAGCTMITLGVESGNQQILDALNKDITVAQAETACALIKKSGIKCTVNFMFGNPGETEETIEESLSLAKRLEADYGNFSFLTAFPGCELYDIAGKNNWFIHEKKDSFGYEQALINPTKIPNEKLNKILPSAYRSFYLRPAYICSRLKRLNWMDIRNSFRGLIIILKALKKALFHPKYQTTKNVLNENYHINRLNRLRYRHQLASRIGAVKDALKRVPASKSLHILDVGAADGMMADKLSHELTESKWVNMDMSYGLLRCASSTHPRVNADAECLPFQECIFDVVLLTAVIEHLDIPSACVQECRRVLKNGGVLIITTPDPFFDRVASCLGFESKEEHVDRFTIQKISEILNIFGFEVFQKGKFMIIPYPFYGDGVIEKFYQNANLNFLLMNQLVVGIKRIKDK